MKFFSDKSQYCSNILNFQDIFINITPNQLFNKVFDFLENAATRSFFLPLSLLLVGLKLDMFIWQGLHTSPILLFCNSGKQN